MSSEKVGQKVVYLFMPFLLPSGHLRNKPSFHQPFVLCCYLPCHLTRMQPLASRLSFSSFSSSLVCRSTCIPARVGRQESLHTDHSFSCLTKFVCQYFGSVEQDGFHGCHEQSSSAGGRTSNVSHQSTDCYNHVPVFVRYSFHMLLKGDVLVEYNPQIFFIVLVVVFYIVSPIV